MALKVSQWLAAAMLLAAAFAAVASKVDDAHPESYTPGSYAKDKGYKGGPDYYPHSDYGYGEKMQGVHCGNNHCQACPAHECKNGLSGCDGKCVNKNTDTDNCGECDNKCVSGAHCKLGKCVCDINDLEPAAGVCPACEDGKECRDPTACPGDGTIPCTQADGTILCVDIETDSDNCNGCGNVCPGGQSCINGGCRCLSSEVDCGGTCYPQNPGCPSCPPDAGCLPSNAETNDPLNCGTGLAPLPNTCVVCSLGFGCRNGVCQECIKNGEPGQGNPIRVECQDDQECCSCYCLPAAESNNGIRQCQGRPGSGANFGGGTACIGLSPVVGGKGVPQKP